MVIKGQSYPANFFVTPNVDEIILGRDWFADNIVAWDLSAETVSVKNRRFKLIRKHSNANSCKRCVTQTEVTVPPPSEAILPAYVTYSRLDGQASPPQQWSTALNAPVSVFRVARTVIDSNSGVVGVRVCNTTERPFSLYRGCTVSPLQPVDTLSSSSSQDTVPTRDVTSEHITPILDRADESIPTDTKIQLERLLTSYSDVFSSSEYDLGCTNIVTHSTDTEGNRPFRQPLRPQPRSHLPTIDGLLAEMQQQGVIEPCNREWASNVVLVKKKDGSVRFCVDYRKLNLLTKKDAYPLPRIDRCLDTLSGSVWYSTFDVHS